MELGMSFSGIAARAGRPFTSRAGSWLWTASGRPARGLPQPARPPGGVMRRNPQTISQNEFDGRFPTIGPRWQVSGGAMKPTAFIAPPFSSFPCLSSWRSSPFSPSSTSCSSAAAAESPRGGLSAAANNAATICGRRRSAVRNAGARRSDGSDPLRPSRPRRPGSSSVRQDGSPQRTQRQDWLLCVLCVLCGESSSAGMRRRGRRAGSLAG